MIIDPEKVTARIAEIAETEIAPCFGKLAPEDIREKSSPSDLVTKVDEAAEKALSRALKDIYPAAGIVGEEQAAADPQSVEALRGDGAFWIVDPLDGTRNFVRGVDRFGTIIALVENGVTRMGWIYAVPEKKCAVAVKGEGVMWDANKVKPSQQKTGEVKGWRSTGWLAPQWRQRITSNLKEKFETTAGHCSAYGYLKIMLGAIDFKLSSRICPWDHAAGALIVTELGGHAAYLDDDTSYQPVPVADRPLLVTARDCDWAVIADALRSV